jgi:hypothetical protein
VLKECSVFVFNVKQSSPSWTGLLDAEDKGAVTVQNIWDYSSVNTLSHPRRLESSVTLL